MHHTAGVPAVCTLSFHLHELCCSLLKLCPLQPARTHRASLAIARRTLSGAPVGTCGAGCRAECRIGACAGAGP